jgi:hypothetical protein
VVVAVIILCALLWLALGALGSMYGLHKLEELYPTVPNETDDYVFATVMTLFGPLNFLGAWLALRRK